MPDLPSIAVTTVSDRHVTAALRGELDAMVVPQLERALRPYVGFHMLLDVSGVTFMDSSALQYLLQLRERTVLAEGSLNVEFPSPVVSRLLTISGAGPALLAG